LQGEVLRKIHELEHFGIRKMEAVASQQFFITRLKDKLQKVLQSCVECILSNRIAGKQEGLLHPINKGDAPL
jgi:hypothetical protein